MGTVHGFDKSRYWFIIDCSDKRNEFLFSALESEGYAVSLYDPCLTYAVQAQAEQATAVFLFAPSAVLSVRDVSRIPSCSRVFCTQYSDEVMVAFKERGVMVFYYFDDELLAMRNAYLTAEGALAHIILKTNRCVKDMRALILGGGRVGKSVAKLLHDVRCHVYAAIRDPKEYAFAAIYSDGVYWMSEMTRHLHEFDVIINTIPELILKEEVLEKIKKDCLIVDLASKPGGVDFARAAELGLTAVHELGIPGKTAPQSAGLAIKDSVFRILFKNKA